MASQRSSATASGRRQIRSVGVTVRLVAVLALTFGWLLSAAPAGAQAADGLDGNTYGNDQYGWSVQFDDRVWSAEEVDERNSQGITLGSDTNEVFVNLVVYDDGIEDAQECLDDLDRAFTTSDDWEDVETARSLDTPETADDAVADLYTGTLIIEDDSLDLVLYLECREVVDATLSIAVTSLAEAYEDFIPDLTTLLTAVDTGGGSNGEPDDGPSPNGPVNRGGDDPTPEEGDPTEEADPTRDADDPTPDAELTPENDPPVLDHEPGDQVGAGDDGILDDGSYASEVGYGLTWDADVYGGETGDDPGTGVLLENAESGASLEVAAFEDPAIEDCIAAEVDRIIQSPDYDSAARSNGVRPPTSDDEAVGRMLRATEDTTQQQRKIIYVECRPLLDEGEDGDPVFLVVRAISDDEDFRASRAEFETILAAIFVGDEPATTPTEEPEEEPTARPTREATEEPDDEPTPRPRRTPTAVASDLGETDIADGVFVGQRVPFKVEWDTAYWEVTEVEAQGIEGISILSDQGAFGRIVSANTPAEFDSEACFTSLIDGWTELTPDLSQFEPEPAAEIAFPDGSAPIYGAGTFSFDDGTTALLVSAGGCLELDAGGFLIVEMQIFDAVYAQNQAAFNEVLATLEFAEGGGQVGVAEPPSAFHLALPVPGGVEDQAVLRPTRERLLPTSS